MRIFYDDNGFPTTVIVESKFPNRIGAGVAMLDIGTIGNVEVQQCPDETWRLSIENVRPSGRDTVLRYEKKIDVYGVFEKLAELIKIHTAPKTHEPLAEEGGVTVAFHTGPEEED